MTEVDISHALERATDHLSAPPDLLDRVRAGGRRRRIRRRALLAGGLAAAGAAIPLELRRERALIAPATRGDLAHDSRFLDEVRAAWRADGADRAATAAERIVWAGTTPAGRAALVSQASRLPDGSEFDVVGFVRPVEGVVGRFSTAPMTLRAPSGTIPPSAMLLGQLGDVLVVADGGQAVSYSADYTFASDGKVARKFDLVRPNADGVRVQRITRPDGLFRFGLRQDAGEAPVPLVNGGEIFDPWWKSGTEGRRLNRNDRLLPGSDSAWGAGAKLSKPEADRWDVWARPGYDDAFGYHLWTGPDQWYIRGATPDRRRLVVQTLSLDGKARVFWLLGRAGATPEPRYAGPLSGALATIVPNPAGERVTVLHLRLPERLGVVVAASNVTLRYRASSGDWLPIAGDTALLPAAATSLEVTPREGTPVRVVLP